MRTSRSSMSCRSSAKNSRSAFATSRSPYTDAPPATPKPKASSSPIPNSNSDSWGTTWCSATKVLTPDSSRFWPAGNYQPGGPQFSFDKQFVRDYLESIHWNKQPPAPPLPEEVAARTSEKYRQAYQVLTGREL
ncbi:exported hypothetical protein [Candidatus Sulfopaludibacter sp. SbA3]|nr:exported hypothetical protein [Candidatus Sulfopaludibacter sp. SbA3]